METKTKKTGFTLIELLVVIVIIGILSTISTATFKSYFGKARDAERVSAVQSIALMMKVESSDAWDDGEKYVMGATTAAAFKTKMEALFAANDFRVPKASKSLLYVIAATNFDTTTGGSGTSGDNNEFVIATWGETKSTENAKAAGVIADGTEKLLAGVLAKSDWAEANFRSLAPVKTVVDAITSKSSVDGTTDVTFDGASLSLYNTITTTGELSST